MIYLARFRSNVQLQATAIEVLEELIRRDLLQIDLWIVNLGVNLTCAASEVYVTGSRSVSSGELFNAMIGEWTSDLSGPGVTIKLKGGYRLGSLKHEEEIRAQLAGAAPGPPTRRSTSRPYVGRPRKRWSLDPLITGFSIFIAVCSSITIGHGATWIVSIFAPENYANNMGGVVGLITFALICIFLIPDKSVRYVE